jgi:beta-mannosidase
VDCPANNARKCFDLLPTAKQATAADDLPGLSSVHFIQLELKGRDGRRLSDNFYWDSKSAGKYQDLATMAPVAVQGSVAARRTGRSWTLCVSLHNPGKGVALMVRLKLFDSKSGLLITPVMYSDNYLSLVAGQSQDITVEFDAGSAPSGNAALMVEGWNVVPARLAMPALCPKRH